MWYKHNFFLTLDWWIIIWNITCSQSKHDIRNKDQLLSLIQKFPEGIAIIDLKDAYPTVMEDLQVFSAHEFVWLSNTLALLILWIANEGAL